MTEGDAAREEQQILLVDDNPENLKVLYRTLGGQGYRLLVAENGEKALSIAQRNQPDLILLDIMMPGMDGYEVCEKLRQGEQTRHASILFLSALDDTASKIRGFEAGAVDYISKPFQTREVLARVNTHARIHALERALAARNRELSTDRALLLSAMGEGVYGLNLNGEIILANPAAAGLTQFPEDEVLGQSLLDLHFCEPVAAEDLAAAQDILRALRAQQSITGRRCVLHQKSGAKLPVRYGFSPVLKAGHPVQGVLVFSDLSADLEREAQLEEVRRGLNAQRDQLAHVTRLSMMGEMATGIAHEVNQPLTAIVNYARLIGRMLSNPDGQSADRTLETLGKLETQARRASEVIQHIRNFVRKPSDGKVPTDTHALLQRIQELVALDLMDPSLILETDIAADLPQIRVDAIQIQQVALNLIRNAAEAGSEISRPAKLKLRVQQEPPGWISFEFHDNGSGVDENLRNQLFQPFFTTKNAGMGVGLTLCQSIIQAHGGDIGYQPDSDLNGSMFYFRLPVLSQEEAAAGVADRP